MVKQYSIKCVLIIGVYVNLVDGVIWDHEAVGSSPATPIVAVADLVMHQIVALEYVGSNPTSHLG